MFPKVPQSSLGIFRVPQLPLPLNTPPLRTLQIHEFACVTFIFSRSKLAMRQKDGFGTGPDLFVVHGCFFRLILGEWNISPYIP